MRLIDADKLKQMITERMLNTATTYGSSPHHIMHIIDEMPTVDPVLHATWLYDRPGHWFCSNCQKVEGWASKFEKYCPYCGAKMDKENCDE